MDPSGLDGDRVTSFRVCAYTQHREDACPSAPCSKSDRHPMLKMPHTADVLPVRIFNPRDDNVFIAQVIYGALSAFQDRL